MTATDPEDAGGSGGATAGAEETLYTPPPAPPPAPAPLHEGWRVVLVVGTLALVAAVAWLAGRSSGRSAATPAPAPSAVPPGLARVLEQALRDRPEAAEMFAYAGGAATVAALRNLSNMVEVYRAEQGRVPPSLGELVRIYELRPRELRDAWKRDVRYETRGFDSYRLSSAGPDGRHGNADDVAIEDGEIQGFRELSPEELSRLTRGR